MNALSFYEGSHELSFAYNDKIVRYPYTYDVNFFASSFSKETYYKELFQLVAQDFAIDIDATPIKTNGLYTEAKIPYSADSASCLLNTLPANVLYLNPDLFAVKGFCFSDIPLVTYRDGDNFLANANLYPNLEYEDMHDINLKDLILKSLINTSGLVIKPGSYIVAGERFRNFDANKALNYLLIIDTIRTQGIFDLSVDKIGIVPHLASIAMPNYTPLGTLVNIVGNTEILYETEVGTSQIIDLEPESIFILPLDAGFEARLLAKNSQTQFESKVQGGEVGVVIDTRDKAKYKELKEMKEVAVDVINRALKSL